ncbi:MAG: helix-turn-helix domain-containing protein [Thermoproteota archaeon]
MSFGQKTSARKLKIMKEIVNTLRSKACSVEEIKDLVKREVPNISPDALRKRVSRYLDFLRELGLVEKRDGKYYWYFYPHLSPREDYEAKLKHSRKLIPFLEFVVQYYEYLEVPTYLAVKYEQLMEYYKREISFWRLPPPHLTEYKQLIEAVEEHLKYYEEIWQLLSEYRNGLMKANDERLGLEERLLESLKREFGDQVCEYRSWPEPEIFIKPITLISEIYNFIDRRLHPILKGGEVDWNYAFNSEELLKLFGYGGREDVKRLFFGDESVARGNTSFLEKVKEFIVREVVNPANIEVVKRIRTIEFKNSRETLPTLQEEILRLKHRIESGEPLIGRCRFCPEILTEGRSRPERDLKP